MPDDLRLLNSTGYTHIDAILRGVIGIFEVALPTRIISYYVTGSYTDHTAVPDSDLDVVVVFAGVSEPGERQRFQQIATHLAQISPVLLDCAFYNSETLLTEARMEIMNALLVYGEDGRDYYQLESMDRHTARAIHRALTVMRSLRGEADNLVAPLDYPQVDDPFYGYDRYGTPISPTENRPGLRNVVALTTIMPTALVALASGHRAATKRQAVTLYRRHINDEWTAFIGDAYQSINLRWHYRIPSDQAERDRLRGIGQWLLGFENHFLAEIRVTLLGYLHHESATVRFFALDALLAVTFTDDEAITTIMALPLDDVNSELIQALQQKVARLRL